MRAPIYQVDAFADGRFTGNPAAVVVLGSFLADATLQAVAAENNLAETAFLVPDGNGYQIRWFTPTVEVALCGHATLASSAVVMERLEPGRTSVVFQSRSGALPVERDGDDYVMDFPARSCEPVDRPEGLAAALGAQPVQVHANTANYLAVLGSAAEVRPRAYLKTPSRAALTACSPPSGQAGWARQPSAPARPPSAAATCAAPWSATALR